jgi:hypothetical protein
MSSSIRRISNQRSAMAVGKTQLRERGGVD